MGKNNLRYKWYVLTVLTLVHVFNLMDRQIIVILQEHIKDELGISDTKLGLLSGFAFAVIYITLSIPIARWADLGNRKNIIALSLTVWSGMTALSGKAQNFLQLLLARIGVGIGEAGGTPPSYSMISDYFPPEKRATALSVFSAGAYIGILLGFISGGIIADLYGWRIAFYALGIPGLIISILLYFTVKEPIKGQLDSRKRIKSDLSFVEVVKFLFGIKTFLLLAFAIGFQAFTTYSMGNFLPSFFRRVHSLEIETVGVVLGLAFGIGGGIGTLSGGYLADRLRKKDLRWYIWVPLLAGILYIIPFFTLLLTGNVTLSLIMTVFGSVLSAFSYGPTIAVTHSLVSAKMRTLASAILLFIINIIGLGFGPLITGVISDLLNPKFGNLSLRWALCFNIVPIMISLMLYYLSSRNYIKDLEQHKVCRKNKQ